MTDKYKLNQDLCIIRRGVCKTQNKGSLSDLRVKVL